MKSSITPEQITAIVDTREQTPLDLSPLQVETDTLSTGDYSVKGLESIIAIERKSLDDLVRCVGRERERFQREIERLRGYPVRGLVIEATMADLERGGWRGQVKPSSVVGSVLAWSMDVPIYFAGDHAAAGRLVSRLLFLAARRRWREAWELGIELSQAAEEVTV